MSFCPKCRYEYNPGVYLCPDCNEKLVESLPEEDQDKIEKIYEDWVAIACLTSLQYTEMILELLHSKNIPAVISSAGGHFGQTGQMGVSSFVSVGGGYTLMVPREFINEADSEALPILGDIWEKARLVEPEK